MLRSLWRRISLFSRIALSGSLVLVLVITALLYSVIHEEIGRLRAEFASKITGDLAILVPTLTEQAMLGDYSTIRQLLTPYVERPEVERVVWSDPQGYGVTLTGEIPLSTAPNWFLNLMQIQAYEGWQDIRVGGTDYGRVGLRLHPTSTINKIWHIVVNGLRALLIGLLVLLVVTLLVLRQALRPLRRFATDVQRFGEGEYSLRTPLEGPPEISLSLQAFNRMASRIASPLATLHESEAKIRLLAAVVEQSNDAILTCDLDGIITSWNKGAEQLFGFPAAEAIGASVGALHIQHIGPRSGAPLLNPQRPGHASEAEEQRTNSAGETFHVSWSTAPLLDAQGQAIGEIGMARDITALKQIQELLSRTNEELEIRVQERTVELARAKEVAEAASRAKGEFLANMSHEIRTPMNGVLGMTDLLLHTDLDSRQRHFVQTVQSSGTALLKVLNAILDFAKIEAGKLELERVDFRLAETIEDVVQLFAERAHAKGLEIACNIEPAVPDALRGDPGRLQQILSNLLGNALKFTTEGEVVVTVGVAEEDETHVLLRIMVRDTGVGIGVEAQRQIFDAFVQEDSSTTRRYGGTGLGLAISRELAHLLGGDIGVDSQLGQGSTFWFTASLEKQAEAMAGLVTAPQRAALQAFRILVVDDNATNRLILHTQLTAWGAQVQSASGGAEALRELRAAHRTPYGIVFLDAEMPEMDGIELARTIRSDPAWASLRLVVLSSMNSDIPAAILRELQIHRVLIKPVSRAHLFRCLNDLLGMTGPLPSGPQPWADRAALRTMARVLLAEDDPVNQEIARAFLEHLGCRVALANDGREAVEALADNQYDLILMDCQMPRMDGFEATAAIRQSEATTGTHLPIIALTAYAMQGDRERCLAAGMDDYLPKPFDLTQLDVVLKRWLPEARAGAPGAQDGADGA